MVKQTINPVAVVVFLLLTATVVGSTGLGATSAYADTSDWTWAPNGGILVQNRSLHTATLLKDGRVLVVGGFNRKPDGNFTTIVSTELYTAGDRDWHPGPPLPLPKLTRDGQSLTLHTATRLTDGKVLLAGGACFQMVADPVYGPTPKAVVQERCLLFNPSKATQGWTDTGSLSYPRELHTATLLDDNMSVLVVGGSDGNATAGHVPYLQMTELYQNGSWSNAGALAKGRVGHTATLLKDGRVLVAGGFMVEYVWDASLEKFVLVYVYFRECELWNPASKTWSSAKPLKHARANHTATRLITGPNAGKVLLAGGTDGNGTLRSYEFFDPDNNSTSCPTDKNPAKHLLRYSAGHTATQLKDGTVLLVAGDNPYFRQLYLPEKDQWRKTGGRGTLWNPRQGHAATLLNDKDGRVLVTGGGASQCELYQPPSALFKTGASRPDRRPLADD